MRVICIGDSLTYGYGVKRKDAWTTLVSQILEGVEILNCGVSGDTTSGMLARFEQDVLKNEPDVMFLMGGSNDILFSHSITAAKNNITAMISQCSNKRIYPILGIPFPICVPCLTTEWKFYAEQKEVQPLYTEYVKWLREYAGHFHVPLWEMEAALPQDPAERMECSLDGIHWNEKGNELIAQYVSRQLNDLQKRF